MESGRDFEHPFLVNVTIDKSIVIAHMNGNSMMRMMKGGRFHAAEKGSIFKLGVVVNEEDLLRDVAFASWRSGDRVEPLW